MKKHTGIVDGYDDIDMYDHPHASLKYLINNIVAQCNWGVPYRIASIGGPLSNRSQSQARWTVVVDLGMAGTKTFVFNHQGRLLSIN
jgi:hypothetical protein